MSCEDHDFDLEIIGGPCKNAGCTVNYLNYWPPRRQEEKSMSDFKGTLRSPQCGHGWCLDIQGMDETEKIRLRGLFTRVQQYVPCFTEPKADTRLRFTGAWIQGDQADWVRVEFPTDHQGLILETAEDLSKRFGFELEIA